MNKNKIDIESLNLSIRALYCCRSAGIKSLQDLLDLYSKNESFCHLRNCGRKTNNELVDICYKYDPKLKIQQESEFESLLKKVSVRALNCALNNFSSKEELFAHYNKFNNFENLKNAGKKTSEELIKVCSEQSDKSFIKPATETFHKTVSTLTRFQLEALHTFFILSTSSSPPRVQKLLNELQDEKFDLEKLKSKLAKIDPNKIYNIGRKTTKDVQRIIKSCVKFVEGLNSPETAFKTVATILIKSHSFTSQEIEKYRIQFFNSQFQLFSFIEHVLKKGHVFNEKESLVFHHRFKYFTNKDTLSLKEIALQANLTRERIRQLQQSVDKKLIKSLTFLLFFKQYINYPSSLEKNFIIIKNDTVEQINRKENVHFTNHFYTKIFHLFLFSTHQILNNSKDINSNYYLIRSDLYQYFDFECFFKDLCNRFGTNIKESYTINFEGFLLKYWKSNLSQLEVFSTIKSIAEDILYESFDTIVNIDGIETKSIRQFWKSQKALNSL